MVGATVMAVLHTLYTYNNMFGWNMASFVSVYEKIPLALYNFAWLPVAMIAYIIGWATAGK